MTDPSSASSSSSSAGVSGVAGRTDYAQWDKRTTTLVQEIEQEEQQEEEHSKKALGLDGKYARSEAEAQEREKFHQVKQAKKTLDRYKKREEGLQQVFAGLLGPVVTEGEASPEECKATDHRTIRIVRDQMEAGKRVVSVIDTSGSSQQNDTIVLTQDLSSLESKMKAHALTPKHYPEDAQNDVPEETEQKQQKERSVYGIIKAFISNVHNCTILIKCKVISGTLEVHNCSNLKIVVTHEATIATCQVDLSREITLEFHDAPSGKNSNLPGQPKLYWGDDGDDRIFHAGVQNMLVRIVRDDMVESELRCDFVKDGAQAIGNATAEEFQFVTSVVNGQLVTEQVVRAGQSTGKNARAMTPREVQQEKERREKAAAMAVQMAEDMVQVKDKEGNILAAKQEPAVETVSNDDNDDIEEVYTMSPEQIKEIQQECEQNKSRGNEAFGTGEYAQAILLYSLALDKAEELPDASTYRDHGADKQLFSRDVLYSNRAACFLKLGQHEKAESDARMALQINPQNVKANFRLGLSLHALGRYYEALPILAQAHKIEPNNKQIKQALQFCEVRLAQEERKRMEG